MAKKVKKEVDEMDAYLFPRLVYSTSGSTKVMTKEEFKEAKGYSIFKKGK